jgi:hypothetical protein
LIIAIAALTAIVGCSTFDLNGSKVHRVRVENGLDVELSQKKNEAGLKHLRKGALEKAERDFQAAISANRNSGAAHNNLGKVYLLRGQHYMAAQEFDRAVELMPNRFEPVLNLGLVYENVDRFAEAEEHYAIAYDMDPNHPDVLAHYARVRVRQQLFDEQTKALLESLVFVDSRPDWIAWARELLNLRSFDRGPSFEKEAIQGVPWEYKIIPPEGPNMPPSVERIQPQQLPLLEGLPAPEVNSRTFDPKTLELYPMVPQGDVTLPAISTNSNSPATRTRIKMASPK